MARYLFVAYSSPVAGREAEYEDWYVNRHFPKMLEVPGVVSGRRCEVSTFQLGGPPPPFRYMGMLEIETDDMPGFLRELGRRAASGEIPGSSPDICQLGPAQFWNVG